MKFKWRHTLYPIALLAISLVTGCGSAATIAQVPVLGEVANAMGASRDDYFPLTPTASWTYHVTDKMAKVTGDRDLVLQDLHATNGQTASLVTMLNGKEVSRQSVVKTDTTLRIDLYGVTLDLAKLQQPGIVSQKADRTVSVTGFETVDTPAGHFAHCLNLEIEVREHMGHSGQEYRKVEHIWFAPGVGPVKRVYEEGYTDPKAGGWSRDLIVSILTKYQP